MARASVARYISIVDRSAYPTRTRRLRNADDHSDARDLTPGARMELVWQLSLQAWAFTGTPSDEPRLQRHVVRVVRRGR